METSLDIANTFKEQSVLGEDMLDQAELEITLQNLQIATIIGVYGIVSPPLRAWCLPTLHEPGASCPRQKCVENEDGRCPGNTWVYDGEDGYTLVWRHYKNADKGGYVGKIHCSVYFVD